MFKKVGVLTKNSGSDVVNIFTTLLKTLSDHNCSIVLCCPKNVSQNFTSYRNVTTDELADKVDLVISVGGDGTLLKCAGLIYPREIPLLGINLGRLGFLTDIQPNEVCQELEDVLKGNFQNEKRCVLGCDVKRKGNKIISSHALNDVVIQKWNTARLISLSTSVDGKFLHLQRSDGIIVATPTGSTAYSLSGGGPILDPRASVLALVPVCPHSLTNRPIVVNDSARISIKVVADRDGESRVTCDGNLVKDLKPEDEVVVYKKERPINLIHPQNHDHYATLRGKLNWGKNPC